MMSFPFEFIYRPPNTSSFLKHNPSLFWHFTDLKVRLQSTFFLKKCLQIANTIQNQNYLTIQETKFQKGKKLRQIQLLTNNFLTPPFSYSLQKDYSRNQLEAYVSLHFSSDSSNLPSDEIFNIFPIVSYVNYGLLMVAIWDGPLGQRTQL